MLSYSVIACTLRALRAVMHMFCDVMYFEDASSVCMSVRLLYLEHIDIYYFSINIYRYNVIWIWDGLK
jgi:hypothetical protein